MSSYIYSFPAKYASHITELSLCEAVNLVSSFGEGVLYIDLLSHCEGQRNHRLLFFLPAGLFPPCGSQS